jgi:hypothetical protein
MVIQFNSVQFVIISVLHQQQDSQLQMQHKEIKIRLNSGNGCYHEVKFRIVFPSAIEKRKD